MAAAVATAVTAGAAAMSRPATDAARPAAPIVMRVATAAVAEQRAAAIVTVATVRLGIRRPWIYGDLARDRGAAGQSPDDHRGGNP
jgi:hypothetical protein